MLFVTVLFLYLYAFQLSTSVELERRFTVLIDPQREDCFYEDIKKEHYLEANYEVVSGGESDYGVDFRIITPSGRSLISVIHKPHYVFREMTEEEGVFMFCVDNMASSYNSKTVFVEIYMYPDDDEGGDDDFDNLDKEAAIEEFDGRIEEFKKIMTKLHNHLTKVRQIQEMLRASEARDRNLAERNFNWVNTWSALHLLVMIFTGITQVLLVRGLLDTRSIFHKICAFLFRK